jgi:hypothetical protein
MTFRLITCAVAIVAASTIAQMASGQGFAVTPAGRPALQAACTAPSPKPGETFSGPVLEIIDGHTICVAKGATPNMWFLVKLADAPANQRKAALAAAVFAENVSCVARRSPGEGIVANCALNGADLDIVMRKAAVLAAVRDGR